MYDINDDWSLSIISSVNLFRYLNNIKHKILI